MSAVINVGARVAIIKHCALFLIVISVIMFTYDDVKLKIPEILHWHLLLELN